MCFPQRFIYFCTFLSYFFMHFCFVKHMGMSKNRLFFFILHYFRFLGITKPTTLWFWGFTINWCKHVKQLEESFNSVWKVWCFFFLVQQKVEACKVILITLCCYWWTTTQTSQIKYIIVIYGAIKLINPHTATYCFSSVIFLGGQLIPENNISPSVVKKGQLVNKVSPSRVDSRQGGFRPAWP